MAFDAYLQIEGKKIGESTSKGFEGAMEIYSFSFGASNPVTIGSGSTGIGAGKVSISSFNLMKKSDKASPELFHYCASGEHLPKAKVTLRKAAGKEQVNFLVYDFEKCMIESIQWSGSSGGDDAPTESVSMAFGKVTITYTQQDATGKAASPVVQSWDVTTNKGA